MTFDGKQCFTLPDGFALSRIAALRCYMQIIVVTGCTTNVGGAGASMGAVEIL